MPNKKMLYLLIIVDLIWTISAIAYDWDKIISIPLYLWPFLLICPIFPLLLMASWIGVLQGRPYQYLIAFAAIPSVIYFAAALIYYPTWMILNGFDILAFGQIFWVAVYGLQGAYLLKNFKIDKCPIMVSGSLLIVSFIVQYFTKTFGLFDTTNFNPWLVKFEYLALMLVLFLVSTAQLKTSK